MGVEAIDIGAILAAPAHVKPICCVYVTFWAPPAGRETDFDPRGDGARKRILRATFTILVVTTEFGCRTPLHNGINRRLTDVHGEVVRGVLA